MGSNPIVPQGTLNRVRASVQVSIDQTLNITASYLGSEGVTFSPTGKSVEYIRTLTGMVRSPAPYMGMEGTVHLLRTQSLSNLYKQKMETDSFLDQLTVRPDASQLGVYQYVNCSIAGVEPIKINGTDAGFMVMLEGVYAVNASLFDQS